MIANSPFALGLEMSPRLKKLAVGKMHHYNRLILHRLLRRLLRKHQTRDAGVCPGFEPSRRSEHVFDGLVAVANASCIVLGLGFVSIQLAPFATLRAFWVREF